MNRKIFSLIISIIIPLIYSFNAIGQSLEYSFNLSEMFPIVDFKLENSNGLTLKAINAEGSVDSQIEGNYTFVINGIIEKVNFKNGLGKLNPNFSSSEVFYIKHDLKANTIRHLYYAINGWTIPIPFWVLLIIPVLFIILAMFVKRILFLLMLVGFVLFFVLQGLDFGSFLNLIKEAITHIMA